jgi:superfamily II DNA or RNA helicase
MQTAATDQFLKNVYSGSHLMLVADEVHQIGSNFNSKAMSIETGPRIGLSATPTRYGDPDGTRKIFDYFGEVVPPPVTLLDAIRAGRLVEYEYHPHPIRLSAEEADLWKEYTKKIGLEVARTADNGDGRLSERAKMLLIQRARIAKKATSKIDLAAEVIANNYEAGQRWLIYCEDSDQLRQVIDSVRSVGINPVEYHTAMAGDSESTLAWFRSAGGVLVSIKCLDEGVDIPAADHALILASSQNPRQFIQRRGRVLRKAAGKHMAVIHDAIVTPLSLQDEPDQAALVKSEFLRAIEFAKSALNRAADAELRAMALEMGFDPDQTTESGLEDDL